jgi:hypothetical protein
MNRGLDHRFDKGYWEQHWHRGSGDGPGTMAASPPARFNPVTRNNEPASSVRV